MTKLTKEEIEGKKKYHEKRVKYYTGKLKDKKKEQTRIGFIKS